MKTKKTKIATAESSENATAKTEILKAEGVKATGEKSKTSKPKSNNLLALGVLVRRNITIYMRDRITVFFSLLAPIIVLLVYILFLSEIQATSILSMTLEDGTAVSDLLSLGEMKMIINNWMIAGVLAVSSVTVTVNANMTMAKDRMFGNVNDMLSSPVKRWVLYLSYVISCFLITLFISLFVFLVSAIYLLCTGGLMMNFLEFIEIIGVLLLSILCSSLFMVLLCSFIKTMSAMSAFNSVFSTIIGFLTGAYLPFSMMPSYIQWIACFVPWTYSSGLFRNCFMSGIIRYLSTKNGSAELYTLLTDTYSIDLEFFGYKVSAWLMVLALVIFTLIFLSLIFIFYSNKKTNFFTMSRKKRKFSVKEK